MRRAAFIFVFLAGFIFLSDSVRADSELDLDEGIARFKQGREDLAIPYLTRAIDSGELKGERLVLAYVVRGNASFAKGGYYEVLSDYEQAIKLDPSNAEAYFRRGVTLHSRYNYEPAIADFAEAIRLEPSTADYFVARGESHSSLRQYDRALADFDDALRIDPNFRGAYLPRAKTHVRLGNADEALADFAEALRRDRSSEVYSERAKFYDSRSQTDLMIEDLRSGMRVARSERRAIFFAVGQSKQRFYEIRGRRGARGVRLMSLQVSLAAALVLRGRHYLENGQIDMAVADFEEVTTKHYFVSERKHHEAHLMRGFAFVANGNFELGERDFGEAIRLRPRDARAYIGRAQVREKTGEIARALQDYEAVLRLEPNHADTVRRRDLLKAKQTGK